MTTHIIQPSTSLFIIRKHGLKNSGPVGQVLIERCLHTHTHREIESEVSWLWPQKTSENPLQFEKNLHLAPNFFYLHNGPKENFLTLPPRRIGVRREIWMMMI